ncbi:c-type cytochrome [Ramlibacter ginsenosidimutans]|uniref:C-type cytochrome n=1 Tax=Ramlibacter ginsenosidimutans TaxID=502333 RepID=A0A934WK48_9BURK|nr:c-type cytochrome [Ramlibacter ginsenosidimutans]MBK6005359.1 c-type cytochrome [Ramlibacter ginsenosidimutans]
MALLAIVRLAAAQDAPQALYARALAANCAACHGTDGHPMPGTHLPALAGKSRQLLLQRLHAFRDGSRPATVMQQIAKGYSHAQLAELASYFAAQAK